jgi:hypothetical protein
LREQRDVARHLAQRSDRRGERRCDGCETISVRVPGDIGVCQFELGGKRSRDARAVIAEH